MATASVTYLTTEELSVRIKYDSRTIRERMLDSVLIEGVHYIRPFGGRKILFLWERIEMDMAQASCSAVFSGGSVDGVRSSKSAPLFIPMANGGQCFFPDTHLSKGKRAKANLVSMGVHHG